MSTINNEIEQRLNDILAEKNRSILPETLKKGVNFFGIEGTIEEKENLDDEFEKQDVAVQENKTITKTLMNLIRGKADPSDLDTDFNEQDKKLEEQELKINELYKLIQTKSIPITINIEDVIDATAVASDVLEGKVAYNKEGKIVGTIAEGKEDILNNMSSFLLRATDNSLNIVCSPKNNFITKMGKQYTISLDNKSVANAIGLNSNNLKIGEKVCGIDGNYEGIISSSTRELSKTGIQNISITNYGNWDYTFVENENGFYESNNQGIHNSFAMCRVDFNVKYESDLIFNCINYAESSCDYGIFSLLDTELSANSSADSSSKVHKSFSNMQSENIQTVIYPQIPVGNHFIYIKYRKDVSVNKDNDSLQFKIELPEIATTTMSVQIYQSEDEMKADKTVASNAYGLIYNGQKDLVDKMFHFFEGKWTEIQINIEEEE